MAAAPGGWRAALAGGLLGAAHAFAFAPWPAWWLQVVTLAALLGWCWRHPASRTLVIGMAFGVGWFVTGLCWLYISMHDFGGMPAPVAALAVLLLGSALALFPALALRLATAGASPVQAGARFAAAWLLTEWVRDWLFTGFPWLASGYAHIDGPLAGWAPVIGVYGIGGLAAALAYALALVLFGNRLPAVPSLRARQLSLLTLAVLLAGGGLLAGGLSWTRPHGQPISARLIQGNVPQEMKFSPDQIRRTMASYAALIAGGRADVTVLPETAWTVPWPATPPDLLERIAAGAGPGMLIVGAPMPPVPRADVDPGGRDPLAPRIANSMLMVPANAPQRILAQYDKRHLVPFGEFIPTGFGWFVAMMNIPLGEFARGAPDQPPFAVADQWLALNICYEDVFGAELLPPIRREPGGATILVNASNIAWFGHSLALPQHLAIARMRALETGRPMLRATNTGVTASIDARGRTLALLPPYTTGVLEERVQGMTGLTPFDRFGNGLALLLAAALALAGWLPRPRPRQDSATK